MPSTTPLLGAAGAAGAPGAPGAVHAPGAAGAPRAAALVRARGLVRLLLVGLALALVAGCSTAPKPAETAAMLAEAQEAVLLVVAEEGDARRYGAAVVVRPDGLALTSLHVVAGAERLRAMAFEAARASYAPTDGGLSRFLFENEAALRELRVLRGDPTLDLALVQVVGLGGLPVLRPREEPASPGEPVWALGHPKESVWSFTAGVVSALHQGMIQHDAAINQGNSGGPLIDAQGRLLGVNTMKLFGGAEGMGYARPLALGQALLEEVARPWTLDRSAPDRAFLSCERAIELSPALAEGCFDWASLGTLGDRALARAETLAALDDDRRAVLERAWAEGLRAAWVEDMRAGVLAHLSGDASSRPARRFQAPDLWPDAASRAAHAASSGAEARLREAFTRARTLAEARQEALRRETGLALDLSRESRAYQLTRRMGMRVEEAREVEARGVAWVRVAGRNLDGTPYQYTECWARGADGWQQPFVCALDNLDTFPAGWPPLVLDEQERLEGAALKLASALLGLSTDKLSSNIRAAEASPAPG